LDQIGAYLQLGSEDPSLIFSCNYFQKSSRVWSG